MVAGVGGLGTAGLFAVATLSSSRGSRGRAGGVAARTGRAVLFATGGALPFGASLYATGHVSGDLPIPWVVLPARLVGVAAVAVPLALTSRLRLTRASLPFVLLSGA